MKNKEIRFYTYSAFSCIIPLFAAGAIMQTYLAYLGLTPEQIGRYAFCAGAAQILLYVASIFFADRIRNVPAAIGWSLAPTVPFFAVMIALAYRRGVSAAFFIAAGACFFLYLFQGLKNVLDFKLPYYIADIADYARISSVVGILVGVLGTALSGACVLALRFFEYRKAIVAVFALIALLAAAAIPVVVSLGKTPPSAPVEEKRKISPDLFRLRAVRWFILPNVLRGFANGIMGMAAVVMLAAVTENKTLSSSIAVIGTVASILGCLIYMRFYKKIRTVPMLLIGGLIQFCSLLFLLSGNAAVFLILYFVAFFGETLVDYAVPVFVTEIIPYEYIGGYSAVRMIFFTAGVSLGGTVAGFLAPRRPFLLLLLCGVCQLLHVFSYVVYKKTEQK